MIRNSLHVVNMILDEYKRHLVLKFLDQRYEGHCGQLSGGRAHDRLTLQGTYEHFKLCRVFFKANGSGIKTNFKSWRKPTELDKPLINSWTARSSPRCSLSTIPALKYACSSRYSSAHKRSVPTLWNYWYPNLSLRANSIKQPNEVAWRETSAEGDTVLQSVNSKKRENPSNADALPQVQSAPAAPSSNTEEDSRIPRKLPASNIILRFSNMD